MRPRTTLQALLCLALAGCGSQGSGGGDSTSDAGDATTEAAVGCLFCSDATEDASLTLRVKDKVDQICANTDGCHGGGAGNMGITPGHEFDTMIDVTSFENPPMKRVLPGDPLQSYVYLKLWCDGGIQHACMPLSTGPDPALAQLFHDWIEAGAPTE